MAPVNRVQTKTKHINDQVAFTKERAYAVGPLPPMKLPPFDPAKMARSEYFPIGGRNPINNNSNVVAKNFGPPSYAGSGGMSSTYQLQHGVKKSFGAFAVGGSAPSDLALSGGGPHTQKLMRSMSSPQFGGSHPSRLYDII
eukprot:TRINITY_DN28648_c0_g2_i1.p1 TRINITY_DN28648_c0_g2~~TRINITY_DN28648_c0_g2_i1.p1  ORF type:complete len:141 (-),score=23.70 TRINITY_DN28648_c0_g2_i1:133-555(-)